MYSHTAGSTNIRNKLHLIKPYKEIELFKEKTLYQFLAPGSPMIRMFTCPNKLIKMMNRMAHMNQNLPRSWLWTSRAASMTSWAWRSMKMNMVKMRATLKVEKVRPMNTQVNVISSTAEKIWAWASFVGNSLGYMAKSQKDNYCLISALRNSA